jgi:hypothetical protein
LNSSTPATADPIDQLRGALKELNLAAGNRSSREIAERIINKYPPRHPGDPKPISHATVNNYLKLKTKAENSGQLVDFVPPQFKKLSLIVEDLGGEVEHFRQLWIAAYTARKAAGKG